MKAWYDLDFDAEAINRTVNDAVGRAMRDLDRTMAHLKDMPFGPGAECHPGPRRPRDERHREFRERRDMHDTLKALERGEISVDEAMERLDQ